MLHQGKGKGAVLPSLTTKTQVMLSYLQPKSVLKLLSHVFGGVMHKKCHSRGGERLP